MLRRIDRIILRVPQLPAAVAYYRDTLNLKLLKSEKLLASFLLSDGQTELILHSDPDLPNEEIYYLVDDVRDLYDRRDELKLRFLTPPQQISRGYRATVKDPFGIVLMILDRSAKASEDEIETTRTAVALFPGLEARVAVKRDDLVRLYTEINLTADDLPYTPHFERLHRDYAALYTDPKPTKQETWRHLLNLRKSSKLPKLGEARSTPPEISAESRALLKSMLGADLGKRDRLPFTPRFDQLVDRFNATQDRQLSPHLIWRLIATLAK